MTMTGRLARALALLVVGAAMRAYAAEPRIDPGAEAWVFAQDIPPFALRSFGKAASLSTGKGGLAWEILGDHPNDIAAGAGYTDPSRGMLVGVGVIRNGRVEFLDHLIEAKFRDSATGRMDPGVSMVSLACQPVFFYCAEPPACIERTYVWRSGSNIVVDVHASAATDVGTPGSFPKIQSLLCPEPAEILQAYLQRYPSALTLYTDDDDHAKKWLRDRTALELAVADYQMDRAAAAAPQDQWQPLAAARDHLTTFAQLRESAFHGPSFITERDRIGATSTLPGSAQLTTVDKIRQEYRQWWTAHQNDPVYLPPK